MKVFIASSTEALPIARKIAAWLPDAGLEPMVWEECGAFVAGEYNYQSLLRIGKDVQAAIILMTSDDKVWFRNETTTQPRDNVLFEYGLFSALLGIENAIIVKNGIFKTASDLLGINTINMTGNEHKAHNEITEWARLLLKRQSESADIAADDGPCKADWKIATKRANNTGVNIKVKDASNLFFILLSVKDCKTSRIAIWKQAHKFQGVIIEAAYDLMGAWDLLVKFRVGSVDVANKFYAQVYETLLAQNMMDEPKDGHISPFQNKALFNILAQSKSLGHLIHRQPDEIINYMLLPQNADYDKYRTSRSFLVVTTPGTLGSDERKTFLEQLGSAIENGEGNRIIESICEAQDALIIETLSTCSQSNLIKQLNRDVEKELAAYGCQKYTLSCYYHDESGLLKSAQTVKESQV